MIANTFELCARYPSRASIKRTIQRLFSTLKHLWY